MAAGKKKKAGDLLVIPAADWNDFLDAAAANKASGVGGPSKTSSSDQKFSGLVKVRNIGSETYNQFEVVGLRDVVFDPTDSNKLPEWKKNPVVFEVGRPRCEDVAKFAVLIEPIIEGEVGFATCSGVVQVLIDIEDESHEFADIIAEDRAKLVSLSAGSAQILHKASAGTGERLCIVRLSNANTQDVCVSTSTEVPPTTTEEPPTTTPTTEEPPPTTDGTTDGTGTTGEPPTTTGTGTGTTVPPGTTTGTTGTGTTVPPGPTTTGTTTPEPPVSTTTPEPGTTTGTTGTGTTVPPPGTTTPEPGTTTTGETLCPGFNCIGDCQVSFEVVTDIRCEDGNIIVDKATLCLSTTQVDQDTFATTTAGA